MHWNIPNSLTFFRIILIPVIVLVFYLPNEWSNLLSAAVFGLAALTDWLDGYLARRLKQSSVFGAFLDPVADKLMVAVALVLLVQDNPTMLFTIPAAIIIGREIAISAL
ncbi:MAG: CDP-diacylglycerol--glycerol-3-phosphate 3-phosphatidyltransferase, partial [Pseudomonadota bacterium]|nr:CDP-diacylglycerol--glycerol-3-phosphate 3-phosphatidyltransferase [Pseudomonadota bacterium]